MFSIRISTTVALSGLLLSTASLAAAPKQPKPDLADMVQGEYSGDVISDARGSSHSDIDFTITKVGKNTITVETDYSRIPTRTFKLTKVATTIQNVGGTEVLLLELQKSPPQLSLTIDDASWSGTKTGELEPSDAE